MRFLCHVTTLKLFCSVLIQRITTAIAEKSDLKFILWCTFSPCKIILRQMMENENYLMHIFNYLKNIALFEVITSVLKSLRQYM